MPRTVAWFSCGAASAVMTKLALAEGPVTIAFCDTGAEHDDNFRFMADCEKWFGQKVELLRSDDYTDTMDVWTDRRFISGPDGAPCTGELKRKPRLDFQLPDDVHLFGYTNDKKDITRAQNLRENHFDMTIRTPLIEHGLTKANCRALLIGLGIEEPITYKMGFPNANCLKTGCGKASGAGYWSLYRLHFPQSFTRLAVFSRSINARMTRINDERIFLDELPADYPPIAEEAPECDLLCGATLNALKQAS